MLSTPGSAEFLFITKKGKVHGPVLSGKSIVLARGQYHYTVTLELYKVTKGYFDSVRHKVPLISCKLVKKSQTNAPKLCSHK